MKVLIADHIGVFVNPSIKILSLKSIQEQIKALRASSIILIMKLTTLFIGLIYPFFKWICQGSLVPIL